MGELIVPGETPEQKAERERKEHEAELEDWKGKILDVGEDTVGLDKLNEKSEYWREKAAKDLTQIGGGFDPNMFRLLVRSAAFQDILDMIDPTGNLRKKYEILYNVHAKQLLENAMGQVEAQKAMIAQQEAHAFMQQEAARKAGTNGGINPAQGSRPPRRK